MGSPEGLSSALLGAALGTQGGLLWPGVRQGKTGAWLGGGTWGLWVQGTSFPCLHPTVFPEAFPRPASPSPAVRSRLACRCAHMDQGALVPVGPVDCTWQVPLLLRP